MSLIEFDDARSILAKEINPLSPTTVEYEEALGKRIAEDVHAELDIPGTDISAMDGYALKYDPTKLKDAYEIEFVSAAGDSPGVLAEGKAVRIFTGAPVPQNADTVVMQELATVHEDGTVSFESIEQGKHIRKKGEIFSKGDVLVDRGTKISPADISLIASGGKIEIDVIPRPKVAVLMTGSELVAPGEKVEPGKLRDSNGPMLAAMAREENLEVHGVFSSVDNLDLMQGKLEKLAEEVNIIVTTGGVSVGDYDFVPQAVKQLGAEILFHKVRQKPGKPILVAKLGSCWILGLPGNPVSSFVCWRLYVSPLAEALSGNPSFEIDSFEAELEEDAVVKGKRPVFVPSVLEYVPGNTVPGLPAGNKSALTVKWKGSHDLVALGRSNALVLLETGKEYKKGDMIRCFPYRWKW